MADLVRFLRDRYDEDERAAKAATQGPWWADSSIHTEAIYGSGNTTVVAGARWGDEGSVFESDEDAAHIARHDPARVLRDIEAKRELLDEHPSINVSDLGSDCGTCYREDGINASWPCKTLRLLACVYVDHLDYRDAWRP